MEAPSVPESAQRPKKSRLFLAVVIAVVVVAAAAGASYFVFFANKPPSASLTKEVNGLRVYVNASASQDPDGWIRSYKWDWGDGRTGYGKISSHTYANAGNYQINLTVTDEDGASASASSIHDLPVAAFIVATRDLMKVTVDGSGSKALGGSIASYEWDFGDGSTGTGPQATHIYTTPNKYVIKLTVRNGAGNTNTSRTTVTVSRTTLDVTFSDFFSESCPFGDWWLLRAAGYGDKVLRNEFPCVHFYPWMLRKGVRDDPFLYALSHMSVTGKNLSGYTIDEPVILPVFGNKSVPGGSVKIDWYLQYVGETRQNELLQKGWVVAPRMLDGWATELNGTLTMDYNTSRKLFGVKGDPATWWSSRRLDPLPDFTYSYDQATKTLTVDASSSRDEDGIIQSYRWDFGDGTALTGVKTSHSYTADGNYSVTLTLRDDETVQTTSSLRLNTAALKLGPVAVFTYVYYPSNRTVFVDASQSHDPDGNVVNYSWSWGDDKVGYERTANHTYGREGIFKIKLKIRDDSGHESTLERSMSTLRRIEPERLMGTVETRYLSWLIEQGNGKYDIANAYEWYYDPDIFDLVATVIQNQDGGNTTILRIFHVTWGYEALLARWFYWGSANYTLATIKPYGEVQPLGWYPQELGWFEDFVFNATIGTHIDLRLESSMAYWIGAWANPGHDNKYGTSDDIATWTVAPYLNDYVPIDLWGYGHSELNWYEGKTYLHAVPGSPLYGKEYRYEVVPARWRFDPGYTLTFKFPTQPVVWFDPIKSTWNADLVMGNYVTFNASMNLRNVDSGGMPFEWDGDQKILSFVGPYDYGRTDLPLVSYPSIELEPEL